MSASDTALVFVGIPTAIVLIIAVLTMAGNGRRPARYRPGRPFHFTPIWFLSSPQQVAETPAKAPVETGARSVATTGEAEIKAAPLRPGTTGGASDRW